MAKFTRRDFIVWRAELADALRLIEQRSGLRHTPRPPLEPFELFDPM
jgi:hypothetical protein